MINRVGTIVDGPVLCRLNWSLWSRPCTRITKGIKPFSVLNTGGGVSSVTPNFYDTPKTKMINSLSLYVSKHTLKFSIQSKIVIKNIQTSHDKSSTKDLIIYRHK